MIRKQLVTATLVMATVLYAPAQTSSAPHHWVATWGTAEQLVRVPGGVGGPGAPGIANGVPAAAGPGANATGLNAAAGAQAGNTNGLAAVVPAGPGAAAPGAGVPANDRNLAAMTKSPPRIASISNQTVRMFARTSMGGQSVRIRLANALGTTTVLVGAAHIALHDSRSSIVAGSDRVLTFGGKPTATMYAGQVLISDPVKLNVAPLTDLAVSLYVANDAGSPTTHLVGWRPTYVSGPGDFTGATSIHEPLATTISYYWLQGVDVLAPAEAATLVTFGDSITDGDKSTPDTNRSWPSVLAARLQADPATKNVSVVNAGIAGNRITGDNNSGLARIYHDALTVPGVKWITVLEGINDISFATRTRLGGATGGPPPPSTPFSAEDLIAAYRQIIELAHLQGIKVIGCTITPNGGSTSHTERGEIIREAANEWIRHSGAFDAVVDFDAVTRDKAEPQRFGPKAGSPDMLHPGDSGYQMMADAFDVAMFSSKSTTGSSRASRAGRFPGQRP